MYPSLNYFDSIPLDDGAIISITISVDSPGLRDFTSVIYNILLDVLYTEIPFGQATSPLLVKLTFQT
jgi:hypothetical protein